MSDAAVQSQADHQIVYSARVRVEARPGGLKLIHLPAEAQPVPMGMHGPIAKHYNVLDAAYTPRASTLDYVIGAAAGCLTGTLSRALLTQQIATGGDHFQTEAIGEVEIEDGVLVIKRIRMLVRLEAKEAQRDAAERIIRNYAMRCPVYRSLYKAIDITTEMDFQPIEA